MVSLPHFPVQTGLSYSPWEKPWGSILWWLFKDRHATVIYYYSTLQLQRHSASCPSSTHALDSWFARRLRGDGGRSKCSASVWAWLKPRSCESLPPSRIGDSFQKEQRLLLGQGFLCYSHKCGHCREQVLNEDLVMAGEKWGLKKPDLISSLDNAVLLHF